MNVLRLERRIIIISTLFALTLFGIAAMAINLFHVGLPTCLTDIKPFLKGEVITHSPDHFEVHYVSRMWAFDPEEIVLPVGATVDFYVSAKDVTHGLILIGTDMNLMAVPGVVNYARMKFDQPRNYKLLCHEFCGTGHERMAATLRVVDRATFDARKTSPPAHAPFRNHSGMALETCRSPWQPNGCCGPREKSAKTPTLPRGFGALAFV